MIRTYTPNELDMMPTISEGHSQDLMVDQNGFRVWLDRTGQDVPVQYEICVDGRWYPAFEEEDTTGDFLVVSIPI